MTTQLVATYQSTQASITKFQATAEQSASAVQVKGKQKPSSALNPQQAQIIDDIGISADALQKLEEAQILAQQLQEYLDYLKGNSAQPIPQISKADGEASATIEGRSTKLSTSVTVAQYQQETLQVAADFDDDGNLTSLSIDKTTITAEYIQAELVLEDRQFFARI